VVSFTPLPLYPRERAPSTYFIGGWVDPRARSGRYGEVKIFYPTGTRTPALPGRPARSQSLYRLSYSGSTSVTNFKSVAISNKPHRHINQHREWEGKTNQAYVATTLHRYILEVLGSNLDRDTRHSNFCPSKQMQR
jgi:hypothetical protein